MHAFVSHLSVSKLCIPFGAHCSGFLGDGGGRAGRIFAEHVPGRKDVDDDSVFRRVVQGQVASRHGEKVIVEGIDFSAKANDFLLDACIFFFSFLLGKNSAYITYEYFL